MFIRNLQIDFVSSKARFSGVLFCQVIFIFVLFKTIVFDKFVDSQLLHYRLDNERKTKIKWFV